jgi:hypothetical protein
MESEFHAHRLRHHVNERCLPYSRLHQLTGFLSLLPLLFLYNGFLLSVFCCRAAEEQKKVSLTTKHATPPPKKKKKEVTSLRLSNPLRLLSSASKREAD